MKLYTEYEIYKAFRLLVSKQFLEGTIDGMKSIELPSDEEIIAKSKQEPDNSDIETAARIGYVAGAKWMRGKILQEGNK